MPLARWRLASLMNRSRRQAQGSPPFILQVPIRLAKRNQLRPPSSWPAKSALRRFLAGLQIAFSTRFESMSSRPSSRSEGDRGPRWGCVSPGTRTPSWRRSR